MKNLKTQEREAQTFPLYLRQRNSLENVSWCYYYITL